MSVIVCYGDVRPGRRVRIFTNPANLEHFRAKLPTDREVTIEADSYVPRLTSPPRIRWYRRLFFREMQQTPEPVAWAYGTLP